MRSLIVLALTIGMLQAGATEAPKAPAPQHWVHVMTNIADEKGLAKLTEVATRASKAGYNGIVVNDVKFIKYSLRPASFDANFKKFRQLCRDLKLAFIPEVAPMGYCADFLIDDPNLAEGMPVRNAPFIVKDGKLVPDATGIGVKNGSFEEFTGNTPAGWDDVTDPGSISFIDSSEKSDGKASLRQENAKKRGISRFTQNIKVTPWQYYHVSLMVKTQDYESRDFRIQVYDGKLSLDWQPPPIQKTMGWTRIHAAFNSLDNTSVRLMIGAWNAKDGKIWFDDVKVEPGGFVNIIRRDSLPLTITSDDGKTKYDEGKDFSAVKDSKLLNDPHPGYFSLWHEPPVVSLPAGSRLKEGQKVLASYHFATTEGKPGQICCCMAEPKVYGLIEKEIRWMKENGEPDMYFMSHDEIRHQGWDDTCAKSKKTPGQILADNVKRCTGIIEKVDPGKPVFVWNDMFDKFHNAAKTAGDPAKPSPFTMYLARGEGPWFGSWEGLPKEVGIVNWNGEHPDESVQFFSEQGRVQILSNQDPKGIVDWLKKANKNSGIIGTMFTNWDGDYTQLENYIAAIKKWETEAGGLK